MNGLPLHPLVVHAVVVLVPLAALGVVAIALRPAARARFGWLVVAVAGVAAGLTPIATDSGEELEHALPANELIERHAVLGEWLLYLVVPLFLVALALVLVDRAAGAWTQPVLIVLAVLGIALAVGATAHVYRVGESGARAVWDGVGALTAPR
ncbi:DUF2231 domain-containing protein [Nocardia asteroides]|uniref:DUF2231 domain-containing protein n=1 Tax=Nocardia asteroides TaxID=1824 RepID=UPI001E347FA3|nr:DUF2231 domain-containing protein [Nocardia asteroides]UGT62411.1 hypothetical protein LTT61_03435 [Nocardia asteroides]